MKKLLLLFLNIALLSCSSSDDSNTVEKISAKEYGFYLVSNAEEPVPFSYTFFNYDGGEVIYEGEGVIDDEFTKMFNVTGKENALNIRINISADLIDNIEAFYISKSDNYYYIDTDIANYFEVGINPIRKLEDDFFEEYIELTANADKWFEIK